MSWSVENGKTESGRGESIIGKGVRNRWRKVRGGRFTDGEENVREKEARLMRKRRTPDSFSVSSHRGAFRGKVE